MGFDTMVLTILLDIDGVLEITPSWQKPSFLDDGFMDFDKNCAQNLNEIIQITKADIVLTSTHRIHYDEESWKKIFENRNIFIKNINKINTISKFLDFPVRCEEILTWVNDNPNKKFVIIDDDKSLRNLPENLQRFWVETQFLTGFNQECKMQIINILNSPEFNEY